MAPNLFGKMFNKFYRFCSEPKTKVYFHLIYGILAIHLTVYAVALARYEFAVFALGNKISNIINFTTNDKNRILLFRGITFLIYEKVPFEPKVYNIFSSFKSLLPHYDDLHFDSIRELNFLTSLNKNDLKGLNLNSFIFLGSNYIKNQGFDFKNSKFENVKLFKAILSYNLFTDSIFENVDFFVAEMKSADFAFTKFINSRLDHVNLRGSNLCFAQFINSHLSAPSNLDETNLVGSDLSKELSFGEFNIEGRIHSIAPSLHGAYYNSKAIVVNDQRQFEFLNLNFPTCVKNYNHFPPTKFPEGFDPEAHGMIDISKW